MAGDIFTRLQLADELKAIYSYLDGLLAVFVNFG